MNKFSEVTVRNGRLEAKGPFTTDPGQEAQHMHFVVTQGSEVVLGSADVANGAWRGSASAGAIKPGDAHGFGVAIVLDTTAPPGFETVTWFEPVAVTG
jgi:hypothetical protein